MQVVRWGRSVYANIQKFIQFQLTVNVAALIINVVAAVTAGDVPLNAVQVLFLCLISSISVISKCIPSVLHYILMLIFDVFPFTCAATLGKPYYGHLGGACTGHRTTN